VRLWLRWARVPVVVVPRRAEVGAAPVARPDVPKLPHRSLKPYEARHLLAVDQPIPVPLLEKFVLAQFHAPRWIVPPRGYTSHGVPATRIAPSGTSATLALTRHTTLSGPYRDSDGWSQRVVYDVVCPRERWDDPPFTGGGDKDGLARAFPRGLPNREEERVVNWLIAAARRLGGSVKVDVGNAGLPTNYVEVILSPGPQRNVDRVVFSRRLLDPQQVLALVHDVLPQAELATSGADYLGPDPTLRRGQLPAGVELTGFDEFDLADLHEAADAYDMAVLREDPGPDGYAILADLGPDGQLEIEVAGETALPEAVLHASGAMGEGVDAAAGGHAMPRGVGAAGATSDGVDAAVGGHAMPRGVGAAGADEGWIAYRTRWIPADLVEANWEFPHSLFVATADRVQTTSHTIASAIARAAGGVLLDQSDLPFDAGTDTAAEFAAASASGSGPTEVQVARSRGTMCEIPFEA